MLLSIESSGSAASAALFDGQTLISECFINVGLVHSRTLMPLVQNLFTMAEKTPDALTHIAVSQGPGSFTGLRIGMAGALGMADSLNIPCIGISTLEGAAYSLSLCDGIICPCLDARHGMVYNAVFSSWGGVMQRECEDRVILAEEISKEIEKFSSKPFYLVGEGAKLCYNKLNAYKNVRLAPFHQLNQRAAGIALAAQKRIFDPEFTPAPIKPVYLRLCQAERELLRKNICRKDEQI